MLESNFFDERIIAISDVHLGDKNCNIKEFRSFLDKIGTKIKCNRLIICGDFFDMWRRDLVGVILEKTEIIEKLEEIDNSLNGKFHFIVGNHDYYLRRLKKPIYPFTFHKGELILIDPNHNHEYRFLHGYRFDLKQFESVFDFFCLSDDTWGEFYSNTWEVFKKVVQKCKLRPICLYKTFIAAKETWKRPGDRFGLHMLEFDDKGNLQLIPKHKVKGEDRFPPTEQQALNYAKKNVGDRDKLFFIFGHTHKPFLHEDSQSNMIMGNTGSWVDEDIGSNDIPKVLIPNTFLEIFQGQIKLYTFIDDEPIEIFKKP